MTSTRKTKAELKAIVKELEARLRGCEQEKQILCAQLRDVLALNETYARRLGVYSKANRARGEFIGRTVDENTELKHRRAKRSEGSRRGGLHSNLKDHKAALLKSYEKHQAQGIKNPNKSQLIRAYISEHPELEKSSTYLRKSLPPNAK